MSDSSFLYRRMFSVGLTCFLLFFGASVANAAERNDINVNAEGVSIDGYDLVSFHRTSGPKKGHKKFATKRDGVEYHFSSSENRQLFLQNPEKYLPAFGGYCSYGVVLGKKFEVSPDAWKIVNGVLFLQLDKGTRLVWEENTNKNIEIGNRVWPSIKNVPAKDL